jgi:galactose-1-phosphate uridylyltransferase
VVIPTETDSFAAAADFLNGRDQAAVQTYYDLVVALAPHNRLPDDDAVVRVFPNLTPALVSNSDENCLVIGLANRQWHGRDLPDLPTEIVCGFIRSFQFLEAASEDRSLVLVPFINHGHAAGATVACPHAQAYLLNYTPALYRQIAGRRESRQRCGVCEFLAREDLFVYENETFWLMAHPAPERNYTLFAAPKACRVSHLQETIPDDLADILVKGTTAWRNQFGQTPDFNAVIRAGGAVGHLYLELVPRDHTKPVLRLVPPHVERGG